MLPSLVAAKTELQEKGPCTEASNPMLMLGYLPALFQGRIASGE